MWEYCHNVGGFSQCMATHTLWEYDNVGVVPPGGSSPTMWEYSHNVGVLPLSGRAPTL
jgi:hypothetical protein